MKKRKYQFRLFGGLDLTVDGEKILLREQLGRQLSSILAYLLCNHKQAVSKEKLIDTFWSDSENPTNALKFAIHRLRNTLKKIEGLPDEELIITTSKGYQMNPTLTLELDTERFEKNVLTAKSDTQLKLYQDSVKLYRGEFMARNEEEWVLADRGYYRSIFTQICHTLAERFLSVSDCEDAVRILEKGLGADELDESLIYLYLNALIQEKRYSYAKAYFEDIQKKYKNKVGFSLEFTNGETNFDQLVNTKAKEEKTSKTVSEVMTPYLGKNSFVGPMIVIPKEFNLLCMYEMRNVERYGYKFYIVTFALKSAAKEKEAITNSLFDVLRMSLRKTDVITKSSKNEIALLVRMNQKDDAQLLYTRINHRLSEKIANYTYDLQYSAKLLK